MKKTMLSTKAADDENAGNYTSRERAIPGTPALSKTTGPVDFLRHKRKCTICLHPDQADIDQEFIEWRSVPEMTRFYGVTPRALYRHAQAAGLFALRAQNIRFALGSLIEKVSHVEVTAESVIRAVCTFAKITDDGKWVEPVAERRRSSPSSARHFRRPRPQFRLKRNRR